MLLAIAYLKIRTGLLKKLSYTIFFGETNLEPPTTPVKRNKKEKNLFKEC